MSTVKEFLLQTRHRRFFCGWDDTGHVKVTPFKAVAIRVTAADAKRIMDRLPSQGFTLVPTS